MDFFSMKKNKPLLTLFKSQTMALTLLFFAANLFIHATAFAQITPSLANNFTLKNQHGENIKLSELRGQVILLNFWAPWCGECLQQLSTLDDFQLKNKDRGFHVLSIDIDTNYKKFISIANKTNIHFSLLYDPYNTISPAYNISDIPISLLIDRNGNIRHKLNAKNILNNENTQNIISELLNE